MNVITEQEQLTAVRAAIRSMRATYVPMYLANGIAAESHLDTVLSFLSGEPDSSVEEMARRARDPLNIKGFFKPIGDMTTEDFETEIRCREIEAADQITQAAFLRILLRRRKAGQPLPSSV